MRINSNLSQFIEKSDIVFLFSGHKLAFIMTSRNANSQKSLYALQGTDSISKLE